MPAAAFPKNTTLSWKVETVGFDRANAISELAIRRIAFDKCGVVLCVGEPRRWFEDPGRPIPPESTRLTGITEANVVGKRIDDVEAAAIILSTDVAIAHNAGFDAPRVEQWRRISGGDLPQA